MVRKRDKPPEGGNGKDKPPEQKMVEQTITALGRVIGTVVLDLKGNIMVQLVEGPFDPVLVCLGAANAFTGLGTQLQQARLADAEAKSKIIKPVGPRILRP